jgi:pilus assembly protein CpaC
VRTRIIITSLSLCAVSLLPCAALSANTPAAAPLHRDSVVSKPSTAKAAATTTVAAKVIAAKAAPSKAAPAKAAVSKVAVPVKVAAAKTAASKNAASKAATSKAVASRTVTSKTLKPRATAPRMMMAKATVQETALAASHSSLPANITLAGSRDTTRVLAVDVGRSVVIDTPRPVKRISVGLGDYAEASAVSPTEVLVNGKTVGETSLILWDVTGARQFMHITVNPDTTAADDHLESVRDELRTELPDEILRVSASNGSIFLRGTVKDLNSSERAVEIASTAGKVVNLLYVKVPPSQPQVLLKVRFAAVDRSRSKQLGLNLFSTGLGNAIGGVSTGQFSPPSVAAATGSSGAAATLSNELNIFAFFPGLDAGATIQAMEAKGLVEVLAEPNLLATSGQKASFLAGGEYPYPVVQGTSSGSAAVTISFKEYGVRLSFIPTVTSRGTIRLQLASEVSSLDFTNAVEISGFEVPAIDTRNVQTDVELGEGQSFAIGGLLDNRETETFQKIPFIGSIPILGKLFQSISKNKTNTELIVIVTPEIVSPIAAGAQLPQLKYPEKFLPPNSGIPMHTPDGVPVPSAPPAPTMPVEQLIESLKPLKPLGDDSVSGGGFGTATPGAPK